jgi:putative tryptophan/tyrosine transport system substrate-binding protein
MSANLKRRDFITLLGGAAAAWPLGVRAQQPERMRRIGVLEVTSLALNATNFDAFRQSLRALGYVEGQNYCSNIARLLREVASDLRRLAILANASSSARC